MVGLIKTFVTTSDVDPTPRIYEHSNLRYAFHFVKDFLAERPYPDSIQIGIFAQDSEAPVEWLVFEGGFWFHMLADETRPAQLEPISHPELGDVAKVSCVELSLDKMQRVNSQPYVYGKNGDPLNYALHYHGFGFGALGQKVGEATQLVAVLTGTDPEKFRRSNFASSGSATQQRETTYSNKPRRSKVLNDEYFLPVLGLYIFGHTQDYIKQQLRLSESTSQLVEEFRSMEILGSSGRKTRVRPANFKTGKILSAFALEDVIAPFKAIEGIPEEKIAMFAMALGIVVRSQHTTPSKYLLPEVVTAAYLTGVIGEENSTRAEARYLLDLMENTGFVQAHSDGSYHVAITRKQFEMRNWEAVKPLSSDALQQAFVDREKHRETVQSRLEESAVEAAERYVDYLQPIGEANVESLPVFDFLEALSKKLKDIHSLERYDDRFRQLNSVHESARDIVLEAGSALNPKELLEEELWSFLRHTGLETTAMTKYLEAEASLKKLPPDAKKLLPEIAQERGYDVETFPSSAQGLFNRTPATRLGS